MAGKFNERQNQYAGNICHSGKHLLSLINDVLELLKADVGTVLNDNLSVVKDTMAVESEVMDVDIVTKLDSFETDNGRKLK